MFLEEVISLSLHIPDLWEQILDVGPFAPLLSSAGPVEAAWVAPGCEQLSSPRHCASIPIFSSKMDIKIWSLAACRVISLFPTLP